MIGYPPTNELLLGCECMDLDHVASFINFPPKKDGDGKVIIEFDDPPCIYFTVTANNLYTRLLPDLDPRYLFEKWTWQSFSYYNWYNRWVIAGRYIFALNPHKEYELLNCFDFQERDHVRLDLFLSLISSDIDDNINEQSELLLDDERWCIKIKPNRLVFKEQDITEPWQVGWEICFKPRGFFGRIRWGFKYIFGRHCPEKQFTMLKKDAAKMRGLIKWVQETNKKDEEKENNE